MEWVHNKEPERSRVNRLVNYKWNLFFECGPVIRKRPFKCLGFNVIKVGMDMGHETLE